MKNFAEMSEHEEAQCSVICLMSHGEEGYLTTKEGNKVLLDDIFTMFNNLNCPNLAGKPKLFFIQSCRDDPINGPAEDLGIRLSFCLKDSDEADGSEAAQSDNNNHFRPPVQPFPALTNSNSQVFYHIPSLCDMLIGYPTQKGYIAYRKPEIGSWYMNAIVQIFSKYAHNTDLCAMLNMVNSLISNEVTNTGKKQMSEYTSKLTKPYFYFFPGLASDPLDECKSEIWESQKQKFDSLNSIDNFMNKRKKLTVENFNSEYLLCDSSMSTHGADQRDSNNENRMAYFDKIVEFLSDRTVSYWKHIAREMDLNENQISVIDQTCNMGGKIKIVLDTWFRRWENMNSNKDDNIQKLAKILQNCKLNKIKNELLENFNRSDKRL